MTTPSPRPPFPVRVYLVRLFPGALVASLVCVVLLPRLLARAGVAPATANAWSAGLWLLSVGVVVYGAIRAAQRHRDGARR